MYSDPISRLKGRRLCRRLPISTATGRADSVRAFRKLTKWMSQSRHLSTKKRKIPCKPHYIRASIVDLLRVIRF